MKSRSIVHVDGDGFFAACEIAQNEAWRDKPVVVGQDKGMVLAVSRVAKERGLGRGMLIYEARKACPDLITTPVHYELYKIYSRRMYAIVRRFSPIVEEYSIDECFADISHIPEEERVAVAQDIQRSLMRDLGCSFSLGLAPTKVLAKVASKVVKPAGFTVIDQESIHDFLEPVPVGKVWGIGPSSSAYLVSKGIKTALEFTEKSQDWIEENMAEPYQEIWHELNGRSISRVNPLPHTMFKSIMKTHTFKATRDRAYILSQLSNNVENACHRLRRYKLAGKEMSFYLKTQSFTYQGDSFELPYRSDVPTEFMREIQNLFNKVYRSGIEYRATGVTVRNIARVGQEQTDLFGNLEHNQSRSFLFKIIDSVTRKHGSDSVLLARSLKARTNSRNTRDDDTTEEEFPHLAIPFWGNAN